MRIPLWKLLPSTPNLRYALKELEKAKCEQTCEDELFCKIASIRHHIQDGRKSSCHSAVKSSNSFRLRAAIECKGRQVRVSDTQRQHLSFSICAVRDKLDRDREFSVFVTDVYCLTKEYISFASNTTKKWKTKRARTLDFHGTFHFRWSWYVEDGSNCLMSYFRCCRCYSGSYLI